VNEFLSAAKGGGGVPVIDDSTFSVKSGMVFPSHDHTEIHKTNQSTNICISEESNEDKLEQDKLEARLDNDMNNEHIFIPCGYTSPSISPPL